MSVWGDMIDTTEEDNLYCFTQLSLKNYFGRKLATSKMSVTTAHKSRFSNFRWSCLQKLPWKGLRKKKDDEPWSLLPRSVKYRIRCISWMHKQSNKPLNLLPGSKHNIYQKLENFMQKKDVYVNRLENVKFDVSMCTLESST